MADKAPSAPTPGSEVGSVFGGASSPSLDVPEQPAPQADPTEVPDDGWTPDNWAKQQVVIEGEPPAEGAGLGQPAAAPAPPSGYVAKEALEETRGQLKEAHSKIERMNNRFEDTMRLMQERMLAPQQGQQPQGPPMPDPEKEPVKHMMARFERMEQALGQMIGMQQQGGQQAQIVQSIQADEMAFKASHGDYDQALNFVRSKRSQELIEDLGMSPQQAAQTLAQEEMMIAGNALRRSASPAEAAYKLAARWGYKNGQQQRASQQAVDQASERIKHAAAGQDASATLGRVAGQTPGSVGMTLEALADIQDTGQFLKAFDKVVSNAKNAKSGVPSFLRR